MTDLTIYLPDDTATSRLGAILAGLLRRGDTVLLRGPIGAGKTHLARAFIQNFLRQKEDVPSPSFTLVQTYGTEGTEIWHADLYRLSHSDEVIELGLADAFDTAICLIEWPDKLGKMAPSNALAITLSAKGEGRLAEFSGSSQSKLLEDISTIWNQNV
jgi:tRNA threonylcarbamoyladenosine biosynthesis protein TsaE